MSESFYKVIGTVEPCEGITLYIGEGESDYSVKATIILSQTPIINGEQRISFQHIYFMFPSTVELIDFLSSDLEARTRGRYSYLLGGGQPPYYETCD